jgi:tRNA dimethylallyltransferase
MQKDFSMARFTKAVFIIGSTAVGKTRLGIDVALKVDGEIVSTDSMQIYQKASLMTAKPSAEERLQVPHHLIDFLPLERSDFTVRDYQELALEAVSVIEKKGKVPVFVGGTLYYVESLLFDKDFHLDELQVPESLKVMISEDGLKEKLQEIDPEYFQSNDMNPRHLRNAFLYHLSTGLLPSARVVQQKLRFQEATVIWLHCSPKVLETRVRERILKMIHEGGLAEIEEVLNSGQDFTKGALQSIGYKEFGAFFNKTSSLEDCIERLVVSTLQYSKKQVRWIKNRLEPFLKVNKICTDHAENWENIQNQAFQSLNNTTSGKSFIIPKPQSKKCDLCQVSLLGEAEWKQHLSSKSHKRKKEQQISDDEETRICEVCEKEILGKRNWFFHLKSKKHLRKNRKNNQNN